MRRRWVAAAAIVVLAAGAATAIVLQPASEPSDVTPIPTTSPEAVRTPLLPELAPVAPPTAVKRALATLVRDRALGRLGLSIVDAETGRPLLELNAATPATPASTAKIVTAIAALTALDPTRVPPVRAAS